MLRLILNNISYTRCLFLSGSYAYLQTYLMIWFEFDHRTLIDLSSTA